MRPLNPVPDLKNREAFDIVRTLVEHLKTGKPFVIGITGAGGAGKTTFGKNIETYYGSTNCVSIDLDDYLISRDMRGKLEISGYNPKANRLFLARKNIADIRNKKQISKPRYDHSTGQTLDEEVVEPKELIIVEGISTLYPELAELNDVSFFLNASEETQIRSRIERDVKIRGYTLDEALTLYEALKPEYEKWIAPTMAKASVVFQVNADYIMHSVHVDEKLKQFIY